MTVKTKSRIDKITIEHETDDNPDLSWLETKLFDDGKTIVSSCQYSQAELDKHPIITKRYIAEDEKRLDDYNKGHWQMIGIIAKAEVSYPTDYGSRRIERFTSGGLWCIESDSDEADIKEIEKEQLADLKAHLQQFDVDVSDFDSKIEVK